MAELSLRFQCSWRTARKLEPSTATAPKFIETVPKPGYRFIAPVETDVDEPALSASIAGSLATDTKITQIPPAVTAVPLLKWHRNALVVAVVGLASLLTFLSVNHGADPKLNGETRIRFGET